MWEGATYEDALVRIDNDLRDWWKDEHDQTEDETPKYRSDGASLLCFLQTDALP